MLVSVRMPADPYRQTLDPLLLSVDVMVGSSEQAIAMGRCMQAARRDDEASFEAEPGADQEPMLTPCGGRLSVSGRATVNNRERRCAV